MKKKIMVIVLAVCVVLSGLSLPVAYGAEETGIVQTIRALGIMVGDTSGNMNLEQNVTRAEFAKMAVAASTYKDSAGEEGTGYSLFSDVKSSHWASEYVKIAVEQEWMIGYTDGSFKPESTITLEQACTTVLRMLGYGSDSLAGSYPSAQLNKASSLGLRDQISRGSGGTMTRRDCMYLFYNMLTAKTSEGAVYGTTLGYTVSNGEVDYSTVVKENLSGPYVCEGTMPTLSFTPTIVYKDGKISALSAMSQYDVYYYNSGMGTLWIFSDRVAGTISAISPNTTSPTAVTVGGNTYELGSSAAVYKLSALNGIEEGDTVMLLLGMDDDVVDVVTGTNIDMTYYGVVQSYSVNSGTGGNASAQTIVEVACTDGQLHSFTVDGSKSFTVGSVVSVIIENGGTDINRLGDQELSGTVNSDGTQIGDLSFASDIEILDTSDQGDYVKISKTRLASCTIKSSAVRYYAINEKGEISDLILKEATGDTWSYGYMISSTKNSSGSSVSGSYTFMMDGEKKTLTTSDSAFNVNSGGFAIRYYADGSVKTMKNCSKGEISSIASAYALVGNKKYRLADDLQVYLKDGYNYYATTLSAINATEYTLTGYYDSFGCCAGERIRVVVAEKN